MTGLGARTMSNPSMRDRRPAGMSTARAIGLACLCAALVPLAACSSSCASGAPASTATASKQPAFATPEEAVKQLGMAVKDKHPEAVRALFGPDAKDLVDTSDANAGLRRRQVDIGEGGRVGAGERGLVTDGAHGGSSRCRMRRCRLTLSHARTHIHGP